VPSGGTTKPGPISIAIAEILNREFRNSEFVSQSQLSAVVGISQSQLSKLLRGDRMLYVEQLYALCTALHLDIGAVFRQAQATALRQQH